MPILGDFVAVKIREVSGLYLSLKLATWVALAAGFCGIVLGCSRTSGSMASEMSFLGATILFVVSLVGLLVSTPRFDD